MNFKLSQRFLVGLGLFILVNLLIYGFIFQFNGLVRFNRFNYVLNAHHFIPDPRVEGKKFDFFNALGGFDAQWYLKIAAQGYPQNPQVTNMNNKQVMDGLSYAFPPLYPGLLAIINIPIQDIQKTAFWVSQLILVADFVSLYFIVSKLFSSKVALKTIFLIFLFPFSIFFRSYFAEGLLLLLLVWFSYFLIKKNYLAAGVFLALLNITKGNTLLLNPLFAYFFYLSFKNKLNNRRDLVKYLGYLVIPVVTLVFWSCFNFIKTGDFFYFIKIQSNWFHSYFPFEALLYNLALLILLPQLPLHYFHASQIDMLMMVLVALLLVKSYRILPRELWWISFLLWLTPLLVKDMLSYSRLQIIQFPLFIYLVLKLGYKSFFALATLFGLMLLIISLLFTNWYWIG